MMRTLALVFSTIAVMLGTLWLLLGLGIVHLRPILCFVDCGPIQGPSVTWAIIGAITVAGGGLGAFWPRRQFQT